jgi:hypothetical protein
VSVYSILSVMFLPSAICGHWRSRLFRRPEFQIGPVPKSNYNNGRRFHLRVGPISVVTHVTVVPCPPSKMRREIRLVDIVKLEIHAQRHGVPEDLMEVWTTNFYGQRAFWYDIFVGLTDAYEILFCQFILDTFPSPSYSDKYFELRGYLRRSTGIPPPPKAYTILLPSMERKPKSCSILKKLKDWIKKFNILARCFPLRTENFIAKVGCPDGELTSVCRQSKLSQEQLTELQRSTHFDKKELQQWYKGTLNLFTPPSVIANRPA